MLPSTLRVDYDKVAFYLLNEAHEDGGPKARFFISLGFSLADPLSFVAALVEHARAYEPADISDTAYGQRLIIEGPIKTLSGTTKRSVRTVWQIRPQETFARLLTAYPI